MIEPYDDDLELGDEQWWFNYPQLSPNAVPLAFAITAVPPVLPVSGFIPVAAPAPGFGFGVVAAISAAPGFALGAAPPSTPGFTVAGALLESRRSQFNEFLQWRFSGVDLGAPTAQVIDFIDPDGVVQVTRGVGDNKHVVTVRITRQYLYFTSWLFPIDVTEAVGLTLVPFMGSLIYWPIEYVDVVSIIPFSGTLTLALNQYTFQLPEAVNSVSIAPQSGTLVVVLNQYTFQLTEPVDSVSTIPLSGTLVVILVSYTFQLTEPVNVVSLIPLSGTLV